MGIASTLIDILRDCKRILDQGASQRISRLALLGTYFRLRLAMLGARRAGLFDVVGFRVGHLGLGSLLHLYREIFVSRIYDIGLNTAAPTIIDCGSNIGMSILHFKALFPDARVLGFEPHPVIYDQLLKNVQRNNLKAVTVHPLALGGAAGSLEFFIKPDDPGALNMGLFADQRSSVAIKVKADVLSAYIDGEVDLLKLDIEGAEELVLPELARAGKLHHVRHIVCEYHHHIDADADRLSQTLALLEASGFGYQLAAHAQRPPGQGLYQDVVIYAYRKAVAPPAQAQVQGACVPTRSDPC